MKPEEWEKGPPTPALKRAEELALEYGKIGLDLAKFKIEVSNCGPAGGEFRDEAIKPVRMLFKQMEEILYPMESADSAKF